MCNETIVGKMTVLDLTTYKLVSKIMVSLPLIEGVSTHTTMTKREKTDNYLFDVLLPCFGLDVKSSHDNIIWFQLKPVIYNLC